MKFKDPNIWLAIIPIILINLYLLPRMPPEYFDNFGLIVFSFLTFSSIWMIKHKKRPPNWIIYLLLISGILGLITDGYIVFIK